MNPSSLAAAAAALIPLTASAVQIGYDPFATGTPPEGRNYPVGAPLADQNPAISGFSGPWLKAYSSSGSPSLVSPGLSVVDLPITGDAVTFPAGVDGRVGRLLSTGFDDAYDGTVYLSVVLQLDAVSSAYRAFELHFGGFDDNAHRTFQIATGEPGEGNIFSDIEIGFRVNRSDGSPQSATLFDQNTDAELFVVRIDFSSTSGDTITVYRNPADLGEETNNTGITVEGSDFRFDRVSLARFGGDNIAFDEIRIGTTYNDVTGIVDPDADDDGMDDAWEELNGVDDPAGNPDGDGLTNLQEFENGTNPNLADSDNDGIQDHAELDGSANAFDGTATDPNNPDSDDDKTIDGDEVGSANGFVTDPHSPDTDGDGESDTTELTYGTNPLDGTSNSAALGRFLTDGIRDSLYSAPLAVQLCQTGFGDNLSELNAAYAVVKDGKLNLLLTGNIESNFNKLHIFIDSVSGGTNPLLTAANDGTAVMDLMYFDTAFVPDYHLIARRGTDGTDKFDLDFARLSEDVNQAFFASYTRIFGESYEGATTTINPPEDSNFPADPAPMGVGYDDSNAAGVGGDQSDPADQDAARAVFTGLELQIDLAGLGAPTSDIKVLAFVTSGDHSYASNQFLGTLPAGTSNLETTNGVFLDLIDGDQFFTVPLTRDPASGFLITAVTPDFVAGQISLTFTSSPGQSFQVETSPDGTSWTRLPAVYDASTGNTTTVTLPADFSSPTTNLYRTVRL